MQHSTHTPTPPRETVEVLNKRHGGHSGGETPGHIPNPEAKPSSADGTAPARVWESRTPPDFFPQGHPTSGAPEAYFRRVFVLRNDLAGVDWAALKADLRRDGFDNGRTPDELYRSFAASAHTSVAWISDRVVGTARLLADGVCNAYLV